MVSLSIGTFRCVLLTPNGKMLDCRAGSLILPGHDGLVGILRNHAPMLCKLGMGIMQVKNITGREDAFFLLEGGFARVSENYVTVLAYDVTTFDEMKHAEAEKIVANAKSIVVGGAYIKRQIGEVDAEKSALLVKLGQLYHISTD